MKYLNYIKAFFLLAVIVPLYLWFVDKCPKCGGANWRSDEYNYKTTFITCLDCGYEETIKN